MSRDGVMQVEREALADDEPPVHSEAEIERMVAEGLPYVAVMARLLHQRLGSLAETEDLASVGRVALFELVRSFDPRKADFVPYVRTKLRWAMLDSVRRDTHGRSATARARGLRALEVVRDAVVSGPPDPTLSEAAHTRTLRTLLSAQAAAMATSFVASLTAPPAAPPPPPRVGPTAAPGVSADVVPVRTLTPEDEMGAASARDALTRALSTLPERQREIVERHYFDDERFDHIADSMGISKSWASRLHGQAMLALADALRDYR